MFHCHICGSDEARQEVVREVFEIDGKPLLVENVLAEVCIRCREAVFSRETTERVRRMVHGEAKGLSIHNFAISHPIFGPSLNGSQSNTPHHSQAMHRRVLNQSVQIRPKPWRDFVKIMYGQALNP